MTRVIIGLPAYNEEKYIGSLVLQARQYTDEVVVVDDGSTDRTGAIARMAGADVVCHNINRGYGVAIQRLIREAGKRNADALIILDADYQHNPDDIPRMINALNGNDIVIGCRTGKTPLYRKLGLLVLRTLTCWASGVKLSDTESGFRAYSMTAINSLELKEKGMAVSAEIIMEAAAKGLRIAEVPVAVLYTGDGSTLNPIRHGFGNLFRILRIRNDKNHPD